MKHKFHNPDNLTPDQIGEGYRLLLTSELGKQEEQLQEVEAWLEPFKDWHKSKIGYLGNSEFRTYRVPLSTWPLPEASPQCSPGSDRLHEAPTDNDPWECLLRTNANLGREVSELKKQRDVLSSQLQGVIVACHLRGYNVGASLGEWIEKQFEDAQARLAQLEK